ncbi:MAG: hypothetical protein HYV63_13165 [Candidatus Schekmanbacteria bacterium]|nr:hypothetical protein [Candidatus Schekmanbacteria bacterium]
MVRRISTFARWLGPWAHATRAPDGVVRGELLLDPAEPDVDPLLVWRYAPRDGEPDGAYMIVHGLSYLGPADPRMDRFCRILAASGTVVYAPFLTTFMDQTVSSRAAADLAIALRWMLDAETSPSSQRPGIFAISFGTLPALRVAASVELGARIGSVVCYGGYASWADTARSLCVPRPHHPLAIARDPTACAIVFLNKVGRVTNDEKRARPLVTAWRAFIKAASEQFACPPPGDGILELADSVAALLPAELRPLFLAGCGVSTDWQEQFARIATEDDGDAERFNPTHGLAGLRSRVYLIHGADDQIIPATESVALSREVSRHTRCDLFLTGLYGHTATHGMSGLWRNLAGAGRELLTMARMVRALARCAAS